MKKFILASFAFLGFATVSAQNIVTLNVKLKPVQTLVVNPAQTTVDLVYDSKAKYAAGVSSEQDNHLTVYSTGGFEVKVQAAGATMSTTVNGTTKSIDTNSIKVLAAAAGTNALGSATYAPAVALSNTNASLLTSTSGGVNKNIKVTYSGASADTYVDNYIADSTNSGAETVYTTTVTYTIFAK
ncbi:hypothetical protein [Chryseobacterium taiwanense]|uniref:Peptidoglycan-binding protein LysM n=1 Tax=Chryseobacterium taiwanense TaxID=363331 RepID=A0A0B4D462_9FLAO|nr:hypothetical protein [Chryseobacterium taiwanense]KIC63442.1 hypothetical protein RM51_07135 [Chryseobacterium taiwanense]